MSDSPVSSTRRGLLACLALPAAVGPLLLSAGLPPAAAAGPHLDAELFAAEAAHREAEAAWLAALMAHRVANDTFREALGPCPPELVAMTDEVAALTYSGTPYEVRCCRAFQWVGQTQGDTTTLRQVWTAAGLRVAIRYAVLIFGTGGQTPHRIRRWRSLLPIAEAFNARADVLDARFYVGDLSAAAREADRARVAAEARFSRIPARTVEGLAVKVRYMDGCDWMGMGAPWAALFQSAAAVAGVTLREPAFDCARWARELREAGGDISREDASGKVRVIYPADHRHTAEHRATLTRLSEEQRINRQEIGFWLSQQGDEA